MARRQTDWMAPKRDNDARRGVRPDTIGRPNEPTKVAPHTLHEQLVKHNPAQGSPSIRKNPEAGKPKEQRTNRGAHLPPTDDS